MKNKKSAVVGSFMVTAGLLLSGVAPAYAGGGHGHGNGGRTLIGYAQVCARVFRTCFTPETRILMGDQKTTKKIYQIVQGDTVWNPVAKKAMGVRHLTAGPETAPILEIGYDSTVVHVTLKHPMVVSAEAFAASSPANFVLSSLRDNQPPTTPYMLKRAKDITLNDSVLGADGQYHKVTVLRMMPIKKDQSVWNIRLDTDSQDPAEHMIVADGIVTGDIRLQRKLNGE